MLGVVREIPPELILPDNILPHNAQKAVARWTFSQAVLGVVACWLGTFWHEFILCFFQPNKIGSSIVLGSTAHTTSILNCNGKKLKVSFTPSLWSTCNRSVPCFLTIYLYLELHANSPGLQSLGCLLHRCSFGPSYNVSFMWNQYPKFNFKIPLFLQTLHLMRYAMQTLLDMYSRLRYFLVFLND